MSRDASVPTVQPSRQLSEHATDSDQASSSGEGSVRTYVLDTCVVLADPEALLRFDEHRVVVPLVVIDELDNQKVRSDEVGAAARATIRLLEGLGASRDGGLRDPVPLPNGGSLMIELNKVASKRLPSVLDPTKPDHRLLSCCLNLSDEGETPVLVTKDAALRIKAAQLDLHTEDYRADTVAVDEHFAGIRMLDVARDTVDAVFADGKATLPAAWLELGDAAQPVLNEFLVLRAGSSSAVSRVADVAAGGDVDVVSVPSSRRVYDVSARDVRQLAALDLLMDPDVPAVSLMGLAGSGKTFLALAAGLEQMLEQDRYQKIEVYRPIMPVGRQDLGFLPGDVEEKLAPWMAAISDTMTGLCGGDPQAGATLMETLIVDGRLELNPVTFLRGRTLRSSYVVIDEVQNLEASTIKTILTRIGEDSKVVLLGDLHQIDNPYVSPYGGMAAVIEKLKGSPLFGHVTLERSVRSPLAELAAHIL